MKTDTLSRSSGHVKLFKWIWGIDPTKEFKTMCPYFWSYVLTVFIFPLVLLIRLTGESGKRLNKKLYNYRAEQREIMKQKFIRAVELVDCQEEAYKLYTSKEYDTFSYWIPGKAHTRLQSLYLLQKEHLFDMRRIQKEIKEQKREAYLESNTYKYVSRGVLVLVILMCITAIAALIYGATLVNWAWVGNLLLALLLIIGILFVAVGAAMFVALGIRELWYHITEKEWFENAQEKALEGFISVLRPLGKLGKAIAVFFTMIGATYKKYCPIIIWED